ncbi:MAG: hypothetical protein AAF456_04465 [Planctomycetota bacterium]
MITQLRFSTPAVLLLVLSSAMLAAQDADVSAPSQKDTEPAAWTFQESGSTASLRGLHVVNSRVVWASGTGGTVLRTTDSGANWSAVNIAGAEELDFRDVHAWDESSAVVISAGTPARIYRTSNGGDTWEQVFEHPHEKAFFDALSFYDDVHGIVMSDPVDDRVLLITTSDGGATWTEAPAENRPVVIPGEGGFAASGTNMRISPAGHTLIALGSAKEGEEFEESRIVFSTGNRADWQVATVPIPRTPSAGIFSMCFVDSMHGIVVGGDYLDQDRSNLNAAISSDGGLTWATPTGTTPGGYRSCVAPLIENGELTLVTVGPGGTDISRDLGNNWTTISAEGFHSVQFATDEPIGWATGSDGRIARWSGLIE